MQQPSKRCGITTLVRDLKDDGLQQRVKVAEGGREGGREEENYGSCRLALLPTAHLTAVVSRPVDSDIAGNLESSDTVI